MLPQFLLSIAAASPTQAAMISCCRGAPHIGIFGTSRQSGSHDGHPLVWMCTIVSMWPKNAGVSKLAYDSSFALDLTSRASPTFHQKNKYQGFILARAAQ
jgi:hypothetical protein